VTVAAESENPRTSLTPQPDPLDHLDDMVARRGHVLHCHKAMAANDFRVLQAANELVSAAGLSERTLGRDQGAALQLR
jgi:4-carboxymuconolactone decarboxylase